MRQVDVDELTYQLFSALRGWTYSVRKGVFTPRDKRHPFAVKMAADRLCGKLSVWEFFDPAERAGVKPEQVSACFQDVIEKFPGAIRDLWMCGVREREREAQAAAARLLASALDRFEILSNSSLGSHGVLVTFPVPEAPDHAFLPRWP